MHRQAADQVGQHGGTNRGLGGGVFTLGAGITHMAAGCLRGKGTPGGRRYRGSLVLFARYPQSSALDIPGVMRWHLALFASSECSKSLVNDCQPNISYLEPTGRGGLHCRGCPLKDADRPRGASGGSLILDTWTPSPLSSRLPLLPPLMPPSTPKHPSAPLEWVTSCGCLWGCVRALYR